MFSIVNTFLSWFVSRRMNDINQSLIQPLLTQQNIGLQLLATGQNTTYGKLNHFNKIKDLKTYKKNVPIATYETLQPLIARTLQGEQKLLWPSDINWFAKSSGTTDNKSKYIPVSKECLELTHLQGGKDVMSLYYNSFPNSQLFTGKCLILGGSHANNPAHEEIKIGDVSAVMMQNMPLISQFFRAPDLEVLLINDWEEKLEKIIRATRYENITHIAGVPSWMLVFIKKMIADTGSNHLHEVWQNLELYVHGGVNMQPYMSQYNNLINPEAMNYFQTYNASEGFFAIQDRPNANDMLLMLDYGIYYEFLPIENVNDENPLTLSLADVELNKNYALIISTNAGLWRYALGDTIKFTSIAPHRIVVTGRTKAFINLLGEELMIDNAEKALQQVCKKMQLTILEYTAAPYFEENTAIAYHEWIIEVEQELNNEQQQQLCLLLDQELKLQNSDYEAKRHKNIVMQLPKIHIVKSGTFYKMMQLNGKLGGQNKIPRLSNERVVLDDFIQKLNQIKSSI